MWLAPKQYEVSLLARGKTQAYIDNVALNEAAHEKRTSLKVVPSCHGMHELLNTRLN